MAPNVIQETLMCSEILCQKKERVDGCSSCSPRGCPDSRRQINVIGCSTKPVRQSLLEDTDVLGIAKARSSNKDCNAAEDSECVSGIEIVRLNRRCKWAPSWRKWLRHVASILHKHK